ncbi:MAG: SLC13 family permease [Beijerinckiaceae bacterium]
MQLTLVLLLLAAAIVMFVAGRPRMDAVALLVMVMLPFTGVVTMSEALAGFSDPSIVLIAALFVVGEGLVRTGIARRVGDWLDSSARGDETRLMTLLMGAVATLGSFMSSTAVVAIFIPVVLRVSGKANVSPRRLMMPLSVAALISGMMTLVATTPNLIVNAELLRSGVDGFGFFAFTPFGIPILALGVCYMLVARRWLGERDDAGMQAASGPSLKLWIERYDLATREKRLRIGSQSVLAGRPASDLASNADGVALVAIERRGAILAPAPDTILLPDDILLTDVDVGDNVASDLWRRLGLELLLLDDARDYVSDYAQAIGMAEVVLPAESEFIGLTVQAADFPSRLGLQLTGLRHGSKIATGALRNERLRLGDTLLLAGPWSRIRKLRAETDHVVVLGLPSEMSDVLPAASRALYALLILGLVVLLMATRVLPNVQAALIGCLLMGLAGCIDFNSAYGAINWKTLILIVGMLPFSLALQRTGGVDMAADAVLAVVGQASPRLVLLTLFAMTAGLGMFVSNTATAILMAPVGIAIAKDLGTSPYPFAMIVALAASSAFMTPISSPVNMLVVGPGRYVFGDFVRIGVPFTIVAAIVSVLLVPMLLPFH